MGLLLAPIFGGQTLAQQDPAPATSAAAAETCWSPPGTPTDADGVAQIRWCSDNASLLPPKAGTVCDPSQGVCGQVTDDGDTDYRFRWWDGTSTHTTRWFAMTHINHQVDTVRFTSGVQCVLVDLRVQAAGGLVTVNRGSFIHQGGSINSDSACTGSTWTSRRFARTNPNVNLSTWSGFAAPTAGCTDWAVTPDNYVTLYLQFVRGSTQCSDPGPFLATITVDGLIAADTLSTGQAYTDNFTVTPPSATATTAGEGCSLADNNGSTRRLEVLTADAGVTRTCTLTFTQVGYTTLRRTVRIAFQPLPPVRFDNLELNATATVGTDYADADVTVTPHTARVSITGTGCGVSGFAGASQPIGIASPLIPSVRRCVLTGTAAGWTTATHTITVTFVATSGADMIFNLPATGNGVTGRTVSFPFNYSPTSASPTVVGDGCTLSGTGGGSSTLRVTLAEDGHTVCTVTVGTATQTVTVTFSGTTGGGGTDGVEPDIDCSRFSGHINIGPFCLMATITGHQTQYDCSTFAGHTGIGPECVMETYTGYQTQYSCTAFAGHTGIGPECVMETVPGRQTEYDCSRFAGHTEIGPECVMETIPGHQTQYDCSIFAGHTEVGPECVMATIPGRQTEYDCSRFAGHTEIGPECVMATIPGHQTEYDCSRFAGHTEVGPECVMETRPGFRPTFTCDDDETLVSDLICWPTALLDGLSLDPSGRPGIPLEGLGAIRCPRWTDGDYLICTITDAVTNATATVLSGGCTVAARAGVEMGGSGGLLFVAGVSATNETCAVRVATSGDSGAGLGLVVVYLWGSAADALGLSLPTTTTTTTVPPGPEPLPANIAPYDGSTIYVTTDSGCQYSVTVTRTALSTSSGVRLVLVVVVNDYCDTGGGGLYMRWSRTAGDGPTASHRGGGLLTRRTTCDAALPPLDTAWRLDFIHLGRTAAESASASGCQRGADEFAALSVQFHADITTTEPGVRWTCDRPRTGTDPVRECSRTDPRPAATIDTGDVTEWTWALAAARLGDCWSTDGAPADAAESPDDVDDGFSIWDYSIFRLVAGLGGTVSSIGNAMVWAVTAIGCTIWTLVVPHAESMTALVLGGRSTDCDISGGYSTTYLGHTEEQVVRCSEVALLTWWLPLLADVSHDCRGPNVELSSFVDPLADTGNTVRSGFTSAELDVLDGRHLSTCEGSWMGYAVPAVRPVLTAVALLMAMALTWLLVKALPVILSGDRSSV